MKIGLRIYLGCLNHRNHVASSPPRYHLIYVKYVAPVIKTYRDVIVNIAL